LGFRVAGTPAAFRTDAFWMGEAQGRMLISVSPNQKETLVQLAQDKGIPLLELGVVSGTDVIIGEDNWGSIADWKNEYDTAIETIMQSNAL
jgi:phosphoribosylformylglycinamidine synthase